MEERREEPGQANPASVTLRDVSPPLIGSGYQPPGAEDDSGQDTLLAQTW